MNVCDVHPQKIEILHQHYCRKLGKEPLSPDALKFEVVPQSQYIQRVIDVSKLLGTEPGMGVINYNQESDAIALSNKDASMFYVLLVPDKYSDMDSLARTLFHELGHVYLGHFNALPFKPPKNNPEFSAGYVYYCELAANYMSYEVCGDIIGKHSLEQIKDFVQTGVNVITRKAKPFSYPVFYGAHYFAWVNAAVIAASDFDKDKFAFPEPTARKTRPMGTHFKALLDKSIRMTCLDYKPALDDLLNCGNILRDIALRFMEM